MALVATANGYIDLARHPRSMANPEQPKHKNNQRLLYKFYKPDTIKALVNQTLAFTPPKWFNDPFEFLPKVIRDQETEVLLRKTGVITKKQAERLRRASQFHYTKSEFNTFLKDKQPVIESQTPNEFETFARDISGQLLDMISESIGVLCLSKSWKNPLMWGHYSLGFQGFCVGYLLPYESRGLTSVDVTYSDSRYPLKESMILKNTIPRSVLNDITARKALHWKYEEEVRYIVDLRHPGLSPNEYRTQFYLRHEPLIVKEIILGMRCSNQIKTNLVELVRQCYTHVDVYETMPHMDAFDICRFAVLP